MFGWLKRIMGSDPDTVRPSEWDRRVEASGTLRVVSVMTVVDRFLTANPQRTPYGVHALIAAGATDFLNPADVQLACAKIQEHGYQFPLNPTLCSELTPDQWLDYLRWHVRQGVAKEEYEHEHRIRQLIQRYRDET